MTRYIYYNYNDPNQRFTNSDAETRSIPLANVTSEKGIILLKHEEVFIPSDL